MVSLKGLTAPDGGGAFPDERADVPGLLRDRAQDLAPGDGRRAHPLAVVAEYLNLADNPAVCAAQVGVVHAAWPRVVPEHVDGGCPLQQDMREASEDDQAADPGDVFITRPVVVPPPSHPGRPGGSAALGKCPVQPWRLPPDGSRGSREREAGAQL